VEPLGAIYAGGVKLDAANGGHIHSSQLFRWDQSPWCGRGSESVADSLDHLLVAAVKAAVAAPTKEVLRWFSWPADQHALDRLVDVGALTVPAPGWLTVATR
jgi:hypothetical protein